MLLRVELESVNSWIEGGTVARWHVQEGSVVQFGEPLCDIAVDQIMQQKREQNFTRIGSDDTVSTYKEARRADVAVRVTSADDGRVVEIRKPVGAPVRVGELLALATFGDDPADPRDANAVETASRFRVATDVVTDEETE